MTRSDSRLTRVWVMGVVAILAGCATDSRPNPTTTQEFSGDQGMVAEYWAATQG